MSIRRQKFQVPPEIVSDVRQELVKTLEEAQDTVTVHAFELQAVIELLEENDLMIELVKKLGVKVEVDSKGHVFAYRKDDQLLAALTTRYLNLQVPLSRKMAEEIAQNQVDRARAIELMTNPDYRDASLAGESKGVQEILRSLGQKAETLVKQKVEDMYYFQEMTQGQRPCWCFDRVFIF